MNYQHPDLQHLLAGEYVIGTLQGPARRRFERLMLDDKGLQSIVAKWQDYLMPLHKAEPVSPPDRVWDRIMERIEPPKKTKSLREWWDSLWMPLGAAVAFSLLVMVFVTTSPTGIPHQPTWVATVVGEENAPIWRITIDDASSSINIAAVGDIKQLPSDQDYELWLIADETQAPKSLGLMNNADKGAIKLSEAMAKQVSGRSILAISIEPKGGSPTGAPTGQVVYTATVNRS